MMLPSRITLVAGLATCTLFTSCSDGPVGPRTDYVPPAYQPTIESLDTRFGTVCGTGADNLFAIGDVIMHHDGDTWSPIALPDGLEGLYSAEILGDGTLAVTDRREIRIREGSEWASIDRTPDYVQKLWGRAKDDLYAISFENVFHYDGAGWSTVDVPSAYGVESISGNADGKVVMCGWGGRVYTLAGHQWTSSQYDSTMIYRNAVVTPAGRVFFSGNGSVYELFDSGPIPILQTNLYDESLQADGEVLYATVSNGPLGRFLRKYEAGAWQDVTAFNLDYNDVKITDGKIFAVGWDNRIWQGDASGMEQVAPLYPSMARLYDAVAIGDAFYAVGELAFKYERGTWTDLDKQYITRLPAYAVNGRSHDNIYAIGRQMILHYDGLQWDWINSGFDYNLEAVCVEPDGHVIAVGWGPVMVEFDGKEWTSREIHIPTVESYAFFDVASIGSTVFVVGDGGLLGMRRGTQWYFMQPTGAPLYAVWGSDENHVYAVSGRESELLFYNGIRWAPIKIPGPRLRRMRDIWGTSPSNLFVLDGSGTLVWFNGREWAPQEHYMSSMFSVAGTDREVMVLGEPGIVSYRR